ncbi:MAG: tRNA (adenosine(37)-N6)-threonylcarbamoyltransferase complex ATPase subunit type 1 TsaE [Clostridia bacterium]|nr:tRNA (adenosine(37)-N6)-threonylcarbamoyltransferase complex ATPase subunit type 1 TsaE [Clostridia bacterium]MBR3819817.1 tRNA (adenosine(37)-N6)-threonylcarbamoyltransferase complex ATPase subunit type 1 TsaE [Clostridia bacterium]
MANYKTYSSVQTEDIGSSLAKSVKYGSVIAMFGDLGAGKTAFTRGFAKGMDINCDVSSPTFALVNEYRGNGKTLYHFDMYRITGWDDLYSTGYFDYLDTGATLIIEWSENIEAILPEDCIRVTITKTDNPDERNIEIIGAELIENTCG